jgi:hypothetical protein
MPAQGVAKLDRNLEERAPEVIPVEAALLVGVDAPIRHQARVVHHEGHHALRAALRGEVEDLLKGLEVASRRRGEAPDRLGGRERARGRYPESTLGEGRQDVGGLPGLKLCVHNRKGWIAWHSLLRPDGPTCGGEA